MYGLKDVAGSCVDWLLKHLMTSQTPTLLKQIRLTLHHFIHIAVFSFDVNFLTKNQENVIIPEFQH